MGEPDLTDSVDPAAAFAALSDDTRVDILRALWAADDHRLGFAALREAAGVADSGQFNYHLDKLVGRFVRKTDDRYELTPAGMHVNGAVTAGAYTMDGEMDPVELDDTCPACGGARTFRYEAETAVIECPDCAVSLAATVPPGVFVDYDREDAPRVAARYFRTIVGQVTNGFCAYCDGPVDPTVATIATLADDDEVPPEAPTDLPLVRYDCQRCAGEVTSDLGSAFVEHPAVAGFHYEHGVDVRERPFYRFAALTADRAALRERDPVRASVTYAVGDAELTLVVDETGEVRDVERSDR